MEQTGLPCSVIINHNDQVVHNSELNAPVLLDDGLSYLTVTPQVNQFQEAIPVDNTDAHSGLTVYEFVELNVWPPPPSSEVCVPAEEVCVPAEEVCVPAEEVCVPAEEVCVPAEENIPLDPSENVEETNNTNGSRISVRKKTTKRPFSPQLNLAKKPLIKKKKEDAKLGKQVKKICADEDFVSSDLKTDDKPFSCDECGAPFVVDPTRSFRFKTKKRKYLPRKILDPETNKVHLVCNACGLSITRPKKVKPNKPVAENKEQYLRNAIAFASTLATAVDDPDAARLYCPAFKTSSCKCLQRYITAKGSNENGVEERITYLLTLIKEAKKLKQNYANEKSDSDTETQSKPKAGLQRRRTKVFEDFVLANRQRLRESINLCERACQKVLLYSNNFLHKKLKTSNGACRVERIHGKNALGLLPTISELAHEYCCGDRCVVLALTHPKLLQSWREKAALGQREARKVLAEMLIPCGGTKANCYKFISMVTGCSFATISSVNDYMRKTKGEREPPEHGMKKWWREHSKANDEGNTATQISNPASPQPDNEQCAIPEITPIIPEEMNTAGTAPVLSVPETSELQIPEHTAVENGLSPLPQQLEMLTWQQTVDEETMQRMTVMMTNGDTVRRTDTQELLHILELPTSSSTAVTSSTETLPYEQPSVSLMAPNGGLPSLANITLNLSGTNVVILPHSAIDTSVITSNPAAEGTSVISYTSSAEQTSALPSCEDIDKNSSPAATLQLYGVVDPATNMLQLNY